MTGYPGRVRSMSWSAGGKGLATSGADTVIVWPFASKDGPMGKEPAMLAPLQARVSAVACHPKQDILAAGYSDGTVLMVRLEDGAEILVRRNKGAAGLGAGLERQGHAAGVCRRRWRRGAAGAVSRSSHSAVGRGADAVSDDLPDGRFPRHAGQPGHGLRARHADRRRAAIPAAHRRACAPMCWSRSAPPPSSISRCI